MNPLHVRAAKGLLQLPILFGLLLFLPAWTFDWWEAWVFIAVFFVCSLAITIDLAITDPKLLERRMNAGPRAETEPAQKLIILFAFIGFAALMVVPALDHRFSWSRVPTSVVILGDALIVISYVGFAWVFRENTYGASTIQVAEDQRVISSGPYAIVRHPMYAAALILLLGIPLALGSWWGLSMFPLAVGGIVWRLIEEEKFLAQNLSGYDEYQKRVRYRLIPHVF